MFMLTFVYHVYISGLEDLEMSWILDKMFAEVAENLLDRMRETMK